MLSKDLTQDAGLRQKRKPNGQGNRHEYARRYWKKNRRRLRIVFRKWAAKNRKHRLEYKRQWYQNNPDKLQAKKNYHAVWRRLNRDYLRRKQKLYAIKNKKRLRIYRRAYNQRRYKLLRIQIIAQTKAYAKSHPEIRRKCYRNWVKRNPKKYKAHLKACRVLRKARMRGAWTGDPGINSLIRSWRLRKTFVCTYCRKRFDTENMHVDHIYPICRGGKHTVSNICRSCPNCNIQKRDKVLPA